LICKLCGLLYDKAMNAQAIQDKIYKKMSADKKITIVDDFFSFAKELKKNANNDHQKISRRNKSDPRRA